LLICGRKLGAKEKGKEVGGSEKGGNVVRLYVGRKGG